MADVVTKSPCLRGFSDDAEGCPAFWSGLISEERCSGIDLGATVTVLG